MDIRHIARSIIDTEIHDYYWTVMHDICDAYKTRMQIEGIDSDNLPKAKKYCENIFKEVTGVTIYEALGKAYGYVAKTIAYKVDKKDMYERIVSNYIRKKKNLTKEEMDVVYEENYVRIVLKNAKRPPIIPENEGYGLSEDDINKINKIVIDRTKKIYGNRTVSDISPALRKIYDHLEERRNIMASISKFEPKCEIVKTQHEYDAETIRNEFKDIVKIYDDQGCTNICYEVNLDNGHKWSIRFDKLWVRDDQIRGE